MIALTLLTNDGDSRVKRDRLELLTALIWAPGFDVRYRDDIIVIPRDDPVYGWGCIVKGCERSHKNASKLCGSHSDDWQKAEQSGMTMGAFLEGAEPLMARMGADLGMCRICPDRPAFSRQTWLCKRAPQHVAADD